MAAQGSDYKRFKDYDGDAQPVAPDDIASEFRKYRRSKEMTSTPREGQANNSQGDDGKQIKPLKENRRRTFSEKDQV